jgi:spore maturation protein CgeB
MRLAIFGLTISSSWGNGHATLWRGLCKALARAGHSIVFFERDAPWYAGARDCHAPEGVELVIYDDWPNVAARASRELAGCDAAIVTSYCEDALAASAAIQDAARPLAVFYDLDTPVTLERVESGELPPWLDGRGLRDYDLVLSYTGGDALTALRETLGARVVQALYGHVDPDTHRPVAPCDRYRARLSYLGTYARDRQEALETLFVQAARARPGLRFLIGGAQYPPEFPWTDNVYFVRHLPPDEHAAFFSSGTLTLNVTRAAMARMGWCPSGRLFEAAACGAAMVSDRWTGIDTFYRSGQEILLATSTGDVLDALERDDAELARIGLAARERTLAEHSSAHRAGELVRALEQSATRSHASRAAFAPGEISCGA